jgi:hypothetical protein
MSKKDKNLFTRWKEFHHNNPHIWHEFEKRVKSYSRSINTGLNARYIIEEMRLDWRIKTKDADGEKLEPYKLPNALTTYYPRYYVYLYPWHKKLFDFATIKYPADFDTL